MNIVKELRKKKGIQQKELAISIGVSRPIVSEWESGKKDPSGERLRRLSEYFEVDELVILGKGVIDLTQSSEVPRTDEARFISGGVDMMPPDVREKAKIVMQTLFGEYFKKGNTDDETKP